MKVIITLQMNCTVTSFSKTGGARHPLGPMDATPMEIPIKYSASLSFLLSYTIIFANTKIL